ncbi:hypothetical protein LCGC14_2944580, partial [marine sediment metagenome]
MITLTVLRVYANKLGFNTSETDNLVNLYKKYLSLTDYIQLNYRGVIDN